MSIYTELGGSYREPRGWNYRLLHEQHCIDATIILGVVRDLCVFAPYDFAPGSYEPELADVDFDDGPLCDHTQRCEHLQCMSQCKIHILRKTI